MTDEREVTTDDVDDVAGPVPTVPGLVMVTAWGVRAMTATALALLGRETKIQGSAF